MPGLFQVQSQLDASRGGASSGRRKTRVMNRIHGDRWLSTRCLCTAIWLICLGSSTAIGQSGSTSDASKPDPSPSPLKPAAAPPAAPGSSVEDRLRRMEEAYRRIEEANKKIQGQYDGLLKKYDELNGQLKSGRVVDPGRGNSATTRPASRVGAVEYQDPPDREIREGVGAQGMGGRTAPDAGSALGADGVVRRGVSAGGGGFQGGQAGISRRGAEGIGAQGTGGRVYPAESLARGEEKVPRRTAKVEFAEGLEITSADDEFKLTFHNMTQVEYRAFPTSQEGILHSQFFIPRQRWYFTGRVTRNIEFYTDINRGYGSLDILDAFISYRFDERLRFRVGRMKIPYLYEYYSISEGDLIAPERSLYANNMADNRQIGAMALGELWEGHVGYAMGIFNGPRQSFQDFNGAKDFVGYVNSRPFLTSKTFKALNYLNIGGSFDVGYQNDPTQPNILTTANDQTAGSSNSVVESLSPTFLAFNNNVLEQGQRNQWAGHMVWFYKSFNLLSEYGGGVAGYARSNSKTPRYIPYDGYMVQATYFLTGEELTRRVNVVKPKRDFSLVRGKRAPGAWEVHGRFSTLDFSKDVFTAGFADPNLWSNHAWATDVGCNWYLNFYTKLALDWQHSEFGNPVVLAPNRYGPTRDLFWIRFQIFF
jgi:phosphate-selective porin OprO/OprP